MATCAVCDTVNEAGLQFCAGCGVELDVAGPLPAKEPPAPEARDEVPAPVAEGEGPALRAAALAAPASLVAKRYGAETDEAIPIAGTVVVGRFDPSSGPVDVDVTSLPSSDTVSRRHAEVYRQAGGWMVRDLGSSNGIFVKRAGSDSFSPRLQEPTELHDGDEVAFGNVAFVFHADEG